MKQRGFILIADITGYTTYLNESELEHAQGTLTDLLELLIDHTRSPLIISRLEGDAVISYGLEAGFVNGQTFLETIETTYVDFRKAIDLMVLNNSCQCNACANVSSLDLKFFVHFGTFVLQTLGDHEELLGTDVNLIHRLLKNDVTDATGIRAYLLCTDAALEALGIEPGASMVRHSEKIEDFGSVPVWVMDMKPIYEERTARDRLSFEPKEVLGTLHVDIALPPSVVWDYMVMSDFRRLLAGADKQVVTDRKGGRVVPGTVYQCFHGDKMAPQVVLAWEPFDRMVVQQALEMPWGPSSMDVEYRLVRTDFGTRLESTAARVAGSGLRRSLTRAALGFMVPGAKRNLRRFAEAIEADVEARHLATAEPTIDMASVAETAAAAVAGWSSESPDGT